MSEFLLVTSEQVFVGVVVNAVLLSVFVAIILCRYWLIDKELECPLPRRWLDGLLGLARPRRDGLIR